MKLEMLLLKGCKQVEHKSELDYVKELYGDDINYGDLEVQFQTIAPVVKGKGVSQRDLASISEPARSI